METKLDLRHVADENNLKYIETTISYNGHPNKIKGAVIGFDNFKQAEQLAEELGAEIQIFTKKKGQDLWYRSGDIALTEFEINSEMYGDDYSELHQHHYEDKEEFFINELKEILEDVESFEQLEVELKIFNKNWEELEDCGNDQFVITYRGEYYDTVNYKVMETYIDTTQKAIGLIIE